MEVAIMLEGQSGLTWPRWQRLAKAVEDLGFAGLFRSDHYTNPQPPDMDSLELWVSLSWLASHTQRIEFGPLVSPVSFRQPTMTARMAGAVDDLSGGRLRLGLGAGWQEREHRNYGWNLLSVPERMARFEEGLEVISGLLHSDKPFDFNGKYYQIKEAILLPRPQRPGGPPLVIGGNGLQRTLPLVARYADEWNSVFLTPARFAERNALLNGLLEKQGRQPAEVRRTMMTNLVFGRNEAELQPKLEGRSAAELRDQGRVAGTPSDVVEQLNRLAEVGVQRVMLQWLELDDLDRLEALAQTVLPQLK
jgi:F420-dependent oxidoreductase-like protein